jgi:hypothetical protein
MTDTLAERVEGLTCPQCGFRTEVLHEGYCAECCEDNQRELDLHNHAFDRWERMTDRQRDAEILAATLSAIKEKTDDR